MAKLTLITFSGGYAAVSQLNQNFDDIETAIENTLSRDGTSPNQMEAAFDLNGNNILNGGVGAFTAIQIGGVSVVPGTTLTVPTAASVPNVPAGNIAATDVQGALNELDTEKLASANNLSDVADAATARTNLDVYSTAQVDALNDLTLGDVLDEDDMASNSAIYPPSQQSVKAYVDGRQSTFVNSATGHPEASAVGFSVTGSVIETVGSDVWESVGPSGSGADNIWTALDGLPADIDWIEVQIYIYGQSTTDTVSTYRVLRLSARKNGSTASDSSSRLQSLGTQTDNSTGNAIMELRTCHKIPVNNKIFDVSWQGSFNSQETILLNLVGYGKNQ